jgi:cell division protease FtsH
MDESNSRNINNNKKRPNIVTIVIIGFILTFVINLLLSGSANTSAQITYNQFLDLVDGGLVNQVQIDEEQITIFLKDGNDNASVTGILGFSVENRGIYENIFYTGRVDDPELTERLIAANISFSKPIVNSSPIISFIMSWIFPIAILYLVFTLLTRSMSKRMGGQFGGILNVGKSKAKLYNLEKRTGVMFTDVAGQDEAKDSLMEMVDFLHYPEKYNKIGAKQPKGALLVGPPGTGKTLLAKAVAGEAGVPFFSLSGSEFVEMYVGVGASRVRDLFEQSGKHAPCIIFIDEIDAIGKRRDVGLGGNDEREQTLNQLLAEMDGFDSSKGVVILAATNRPEILDKALLRPGRFDRRVIVEKPDLPGREAILKVHGAKIKLSENINLKEIALATSGATGADLANMINEAALRAVKSKREVVLQEDLMESVEVVFAGKEKKDRILNPKEKQLVAYHEVGHALASALQKNSQPVQKITIIPRTMGALGYTMQIPEEERYLQTKNELNLQIITLMAGRTAEEIVFGEMTTGASNDIERATKLARSMVTQYGMSEKFDMMFLESIENQYLDGRNVSTCSETTGALIDREVRQIIKDCREKAAELLLKNKESLIRISEHLIKEESITGQRFMELLNNQA